MISGVEIFGGEGVRRVSYRHTNKFRTSLHSKRNVFSGLGEDPKSGLIQSGWFPLKGKLTKFRVD